MMESRDVEEIKDCIGLFLTPEETKVHGRPIYIEQMVECGLVVDERSVGSELWSMIRELHVRLENFVTSHASKCIESKEDSFVSRHGMDQES